MRAREDAALLEVRDGVLRVDLPAWGSAVLSPAPVE